MNHVVFKLSVVGLLSLAVIAAENNKATFDGTWILDTTKSDFQDLDAPTHVVIRVDQLQDRLTVVEVSKGEYGETVLKSDYTFDGQERSVGKATLLRNAVRTERWTLVKGGRDLLIERTGCEGSVRLIFKRSTIVVETRRAGLRHR
jgi:hypothetical protein